MPLRYNSRFISLIRLLASTSCACRVAYEQTVIEAFADVEKALVSIETYRKQATRQAQLVLANSRISEMNRELYRNGMSAYLDVIDAERELYASQMQFVEIAVQQYVNYVGLYKALGGGW